LPGGRITIGAELIESELRIWVEDTGVGIPADGLQKVFERFVQLDNYPEEGRQGFGLGLSIAREIVEAMAGRIEVISEIGAGSTFSIRLPI
ncbi:sensor histidine kinase, partial [bacterium]|nr:sensor histidine kinase [bacterium]